MAPLIFLIALVSANEYALVDRTRDVYKISKYIVLPIADDIASQLDIVKAEYRLNVSISRLFTLSHISENSISVPIWKDADRLLMYRIQSTPVKHPVNDVYKYRYKLDTQYIGITPDGSSYAVDIQPCYEEPCLFDGVQLLNLKNTPSCISGLYTNNIAVIEGLCTYETTRHKTPPIVYALRNRLHVFSEEKMKLNVACPHNSIRSLPIPPMTKTSTSFRPGCRAWNLDVVISKALIANETLESIPPLKTRCNGAPICVLPLVLTILNIALATGHIAIPRLKSRRYDKTERVQTRQC